MSAVSEWDTPVTHGSQGGGTYETCPAGNHPGTIFGVLNVGSHEKQRDDGTTYEVNELVYLIELVEEKADGSPFIFGLRCARSMNDRSTMYDMACAVLGQTFAEGAKFDPRDLLNQPCMVSIVHKAGKSKQGGDVVYANIASKGVKGFSKKMQAPKPVMENLVWSINGSAPIPDYPWLPRLYGKTIRQIVEESREYRQRGPAMANSSNSNGHHDEVDDKGY